MFAARLAGEILHLTGLGLIVVNSRFIWALL